MYNIKKAKPHRFTTDMTDGNPTGLIIRFMIPMVIGNVFQQLYNLVDTVIVGKAIDADALAAVGATGSLNFLFFSLCNGLANGIGISVSHAFGAGDNETVRKTIANAFYIMTVAAVMMGGLGILLARPVLTLLKTPGNIIDDSVLYMQIVSAGVIAVSMYNCISAILRGLGDSKTPLYFLVVSSVINVCLDLFFIINLHWGVAGAAIATIIAQASAAVGSLIYSIKTNPEFRIERNEWKPDTYIIHKSCMLGLPLAGQSSMIALSCVILQGVVNPFGSVVCAAFTATGRVEQLIHQPFNSLGMALSTYTGQNIGANKPDRVDKGLRQSMIIMLILCAVIIPIFQLFSPSIMGVFVKQEEAEVIAVGAQALRLTSWFYIPLGMIYVCRGLLNGAGDAVYSFMNGVYEMIGRTLFPKPLTMIPHVGVWGIWWGTALTWTMTGIYGFVRYKRGKWRVKTIERNR